jgi:predicted enzyme related to lactoylglutathione lyase
MTLHAIAGTLLLLACVLAQNGAVPAALDVRYVANAGVLLTIDGRKVLIDGPIRDGIPPYTTPSADERSRLETARPPYDGIAAILLKLRIGIVAASRTRGCIVPECPHFREQWGLGLSQGSRTTWPIRRRANQRTRNRMAIMNAVASVAVKDVDSAVKWYEKVLGKPPDSRPMPEVAEWKFERGGWLQVYGLPERAGSGSVTLAVTDIDDEVAKLTRLGVDTAQRSSGAKVKTLMITDPDGNHIAFAEAIDRTMAR